jgi:hypothetical protein
MSLRDDWTLLRWHLLNFHFYVMLLILNGFIIWGYCHCFVAMAAVCLVCWIILYRRPCSLKNRCNCFSHRQHKRGLQAQSDTHPSQPPLPSKGNTVHSSLLSSNHGPNIYKDTKPQMSAFLKYWPVKVLICLRWISVWGPLPYLVFVWDGKAIL